MTESSRGILTEADRKFLRMDPSERLDEYSRSAISQRRGTIQTRVYQGLSDLELLFDHLPKRSREKVFSSFERGLIFHKRTQLLRYGTAFLLLGVIEQENVEFDDEEHYEKVFYHVIETVLNKSGLGAETIDVDVTIEGWDNPDEGLAASDLTELTEEALRYLLFDGQISSEEFARGILEEEE